MFRNRCRLIAESNPGPWTMRVGCDLRSTSGPGALCRGSKYRQMSSSMRHSLVIAPGSCLHRNRYRRRSPEPPKLNRITTKRAAMVSLQCREPKPPMSQMGHERHRNRGADQSLLDLSKRTGSLQRQERPTSCITPNVIAHKPIILRRSIVYSLSDAEGATPTSLS